jgi:hypothetical protein
MTRRTGKSYERQVMRHLLQERERVAFEWDAEVPDGTGLHKRQVDIWLPDSREIVECKDHARPVDIGVVDRLVGAVADVNASAGRLFSSSGFTPLALARALKEPIECIPLPFENRFKEPFPATGGGYYSGDYIEDCRCSVPSDLAFDYGRIIYVDRDENFWPICASLSVDWASSKARRFVAYLLLAHNLTCPPSETAIRGLVDFFGYRLEPGQEWSISEDEVRSLAEAE